jgi:hypothetical protein
LGRDGITVTTIIPGLMRTGSYLNAEFTGEPEQRDATYRLFSAMSSLPLLTVNAESAAHQFVRAIKRGDGYFIYPPQYNLIARIHGLAPATTMAAMGLAARLMPETGDETRNVRGETIDDRLEPTGVSLEQWVISSWSQDPPRQDLHSSLSVPSIMAICCM